LRYLFENYVLDTDRRELRRGDELLPVEPKVFDLLVYLIANREHVVSKDDLIAAIWDGRIVSESALTTCLNAARSAIGDNGNTQRLIKTLPRKGFRFVGTARDHQQHADLASEQKPVLSLPNQPSIAVLPFMNMSGDPEQEYFADGMVEDITVALSRVRWLFVIARNSSFTYKGKAVDVKQVGRELGVRYVLEGSVRKAASRVRINAQLIDASTGAHLWADRFESELVELFDLQDQLTVSVVGAIAPKLAQAEIERARRKPIGSLDAYDYYWRGWASADQVTREATADALRLFSKAIELDPNLGLAHGRAALCYTWRSYNGWTTDRERETAEALRLARRAVELDRDEALALSWAGMTLTYFIPDSEEGAALLERALALNANLMQAWFGTGWVRIWRGQLDAAIEAFGRAMRLSPLDPFIFAMQRGIALAHFLADRNDEASLWAERALRAYQNDLGALQVEAASNALAGRLEQARKAIGRLRQLEPKLRVSNLKSPTRQPEGLDKFAAALRIAGLPQ